jgi:hypothetical protein
MESTERPETSSPSSSSSSPTTTTASGDTVTLTGPDLVIELPDEWSEIPLADVRAQLEGRARQVPAFRATFRKLAKQIDDGVIVAYAYGPVVNGTSIPTFVVSVESGDVSLRSAVKRREKLFRALLAGVPFQIDERSPASLPVGRAMRIRAHSNPSFGIPSQNIEYVLLLDQKTVSISGTAPADYTEFDDVMAGVADELSPRP